MAPLRCVFLAARCLLTGPILTKGVAAEEPQDSIRSQLRRYVEAFNGRDFESIAAVMDSEMKYLDETSGDQTDGASDFVKRIQGALEAEPSLKLEASIDGIETPQPDTAIVTGTATLTSDQTPEERSSFQVKMAQRQSTWKITSITEQLLQPTSVISADEAMASLAWLVGTWKDSSPDQLRSEIAFLPGERLLRRILFEPATDRELGFEIIGYDPSRNRVRSWLYFADGTFGSGDWIGEEDHWRVKMTQTLEDGRKATGTYVIRPTDENTMVVKVVDRQIGGAPMPSGKEVTLSRVENDQRDENDSEPTAGTK